MPSKAIQTLSIVVVGGGAGGLELLGVLSHV